MPQYSHRHHWPLSNYSLSLSQLHRAVSRGQPRETQGQGTRGLETVNPANNDSLDRYDTARTLKDTLFCPQSEQTAVYSHTHISDLFLWSDSFCWTELPHMAPLLLLFILLGIVFCCVFVPLHFNPLKWTCAASLRGKTGFVLTKGNHCTVITEMRDCIDNRKKINQCAILILNISQPSVKTVRLAIVWPVLKEQFTQNLKHMQEEPCSYSCLWRCRMETFMASSAAFSFWAPQAKIFLLPWYSGVHVHLCSWCLQNSATRTKTIMMSKQLCRQRGTKCICHFWVNWTLFIYWSVQFQICANLLHETSWISYMFHRYDVINAVTVDICCSGGLCMKTFSDPVFSLRGHSHQTMNHCRMCAH